jgi:hypothetical protein
VVVVHGRDRAPLFLRDATTTRSPAYHKEHQRLTRLARGDSREAFALFVKELKQATRRSRLPQGAF